jgi:hypothetical protein
MCKINTRCGRRLPNRKKLTPAPAEVFRFVTLLPPLPDDNGQFLKNMIFANINEDNISSLLHSKDSKSMQRSVARSIKLFKDYLLQKDESVDFETFSKVKFIVITISTVFHFLLLYYLS